MQKLNDIAETLMGSPYAALDQRSRKVVRHIAGRKHITRNTTSQFDAKATRGQRAADAVARFGGSWTFIGIFAAIMLAWMVLNSFILVGYRFDAYPHILLNLLLSMLAAIQAPIILMSQNRHAEKDRIDAEHDYEVNLKAELEIMLLHEKIDALRQCQLSELLAMQKEQLALLTNLTRPEPVPKSRAEPS